MHLDGNNVVSDIKVERRCLKKTEETVKAANKQKLKRQKKKEKEIIEKKKKDARRMRTKRIKWTVN